MEKYYKSSGKFNPIAFLYFIGVALIALPILGALYAYAIWYIPFIYINLFIAIGISFLIGLSISLGVIKLGKVRNVPLTIIFSFLAATIALYLHWTVWIDLVINAGESYGTSRIGVTVSNIDLLQTFDLALQPDVLFELIGQVNEYGTWGIKSSTVSGTFLTVIWIIEAIIIIGVATFFPISYARLPFCELDNSWFKENKLPPFGYIENPSEMVKNLETSNPNTFKETEISKNLKENYSVFTLYSSNHKDNYLTIKNMLAKTNKKGELEFEGDEFVEYIYLNSELKQLLLAIK